MRKKMVSLLLSLLMCFSASAGCAPEQEKEPPEEPAVAGTELFCDTDFTAFGIPEALGTEWSVDTRDHKGRITKIRSLSTPVYLIPYGRATEPDGVTLVPESENVHWDFIEGEKYNVTDPAGEKLAELLDFRTCVNAEIVENSEDKLIFEQYNDYLHETYPDRYPASDKKLVKRVETDKNGTIRIAYNSYHDIVNESYSFTAKFANNTWPHFYLNQNFHAPVDLARYEKLNYGVTLKITKADAVNRWPEGDSDRYDQPAVPAGEPKVCVAQLQGYFLLRDKTDYTCWFVGLNYWSSNASDQLEVFTNEQHGVPFYRIGTTQPQGDYYGMEGELLEVGKEVTVTYDLYRQIRYVLDRKLLVGEKYANGGLNPYYGKTIDDYYIADFHIGWENIGNWDCAFEMKDLYLRGVEK